MNKAGTFHLKNILSMYCWKCGAELQEGRPNCIMCGAAAHKAGFWSRLASLFSKTGMPSVSFSTKIQTSTGDANLAAVEKALGSLEKIPGVHVNMSVKTNRVYKFRDASGNEQTFHSLEEMPPEIRKVFDRTKLE